MPDPGGSANKDLPIRARSAPQAQRALRQQRRDYSDHGRRWRLARRVGELFGEFLAEALLASVALALFAGVLAAAAWGWQHSPAATVVLVAGIVLFLAFGVHQLATRRAGQRKRGRLAAAAVGTVVFVLVWAMYLVIYLPSP